MVAERFKGVHNVNQFVCVLLSVDVEERMQLRSRCGGQEVP
jgi:hypothetical protein